MKNSITPITQLLAVATFVIITNFLLNKILLGNTPFIGFTIIVIGFCLDYLILMYLQQKTAVFRGLDILQYLCIFFSSWIIYVLFFFKDLILNTNDDAKVVMLREHNINIVVSTVLILLFQHLNKKNTDIYKFSNLYLFSASILILFLWRMIFTRLL